MACRLFVLAVVVQTIIDLAIEGELLLRFPDSPNSDNSDGRNAEAMRRDRMPIYLGIFAFAQCVNPFFSFSIQQLRSSIASFSW
jgi:hypothetical protein